MEVEHNVLLTNLLTRHCTKFDIPIVESEMYKQNSIRISGMSMPILSKYCESNCFSDKQLEIIREGLQRNVDVTIYAHPDIPENVMLQILHSLTTVSRYNIHYVDSDSDYKVDTRTAHTKLEALKHFYAAHKDVIVVSVNEVG